MFEPEPLHAMQGLYRLAVAGQMAHHFGVVGFGENQSLTGF